MILLMCCSFGTSDMFVLVWHQAYLVYKWATPAAPRPEEYPSTYNVDRQRVCKRTEPTTIYSSATILGHTPYEYEYKIRTYLHSYSWWNLAQTVSSRCYITFYLSYPFHQNAQIPPARSPFMFFSKHFSACTANARSTTALHFILSIRLILSLRSL